MSGFFDPAADAAILMSAGGAGAAGTGAHSLAALWLTEANSNGSLASLYASSTQVRQLLSDGGELFGSGDFSNGYPLNSVLGSTWYVAVITKPAGSAHYRCHLWPYASNGSGVFDHGEASNAANHGDGSSITQIRIGQGDTRGNGSIAVVGVWNTELSDAQINTLRSGNLSAWSALSPAELISLQNWDGTNGATAVVGTSAKTGITGTVGVGANPPGFNFALTTTVALVGAMTVGGITGAGTITRKVNMTAAAAVGGITGAGTLKRTVNLAGAQLVGGITGTAGLKRTVHLAGSMLVGGIIGHGSFGVEAVAGRRPIVSSRTARPVVSSGRASAIVTSSARRPA